MLPPRADEGEGKGGRRGGEGREGEGRGGEGKEDNGAKTKSTSSSQGRWEGLQVTV